jgi:hypothetical protein
VRDPDRASTAPGLRPDLPSRLGAALFGRSRDARQLSLVLLGGFVLLFAGLEVVRVSPQWGFTYGGAIGGVLSQLGVTGPAALLVAAATAANLLAGAAVLRLTGTPPFRSLTDMVLAGFATAVVLDAATLFLLGSLGLFGWPELILLHAVIAFAWLAAGRSRPLLAGSVRVHFSRPAAWWPLVLAIWAGPLIVQLASPTVPFLDVLPNHVAPVEHVRVFGSFATLTTSPSPIYGPSRLMLGYVALLGQLTTVTNLDGVLAEAAFGLPLTILMALAVRRLTERLFGGSAGFWVLLTFPLTFTFMRIPDARDTVVVFPLVALTLIRIAEELRRPTSAEPPLVRPPSAGPQSAGPPEARPRPTRSPIAEPPLVRPDLSLVFAIGGAFLLHPLIGLVTFAAAAGALVLYPARLARKLIPALGAGAVLAIPQALTVAGIGAPAWVGLVCVVIGLAVAFSLAPVVSWVVDNLPTTPAVPAHWRAAVVAIAILVLLQIARTHIDPPDDPASEIPTDFLRLLDLCLLGALLSVFAGLGRGWILLGCGIAAGVGAWAISGLVGFNGLTEQAIHYEVPKSMEYWIPAMLAIGAAGALAAIVRLRWLGLLRPLAIGAYVIVSVYPFTDPIAVGPLVISDPRIDAPLVSSFQIGEHREAESLGLALFEAELGYWDQRSSSKPYPDPRLIIDEPRREVVDELRAEEEAGRLGPSTKVLNIASSFQQWVAVPVGVFTGAMETSISLQPEVSIHTDGGRLLGFEVLERELLAGDYDYVLLEPSGLPPDVTANIRTDFVAYGYHPIFSNSQATIYAHR